MNNKTNYIFKIGKYLLLIFGILLIIVLSCSCNEHYIESVSESDTPPQNTQQDSPETELQLTTENEFVQEPKVIDISSDDYYALITNVFTEATKRNGYFEFFRYDTYKFPYLQVYIVPTDKRSNETTKIQSKALIEDVLEQLQKYEYKSGGWFKRECEYINIYFYGYDQYGNYNRNGGPFIQINIFNVQNISAENLIY